LKRYAVAFLRSPYVDTSLYDRIVFPLYFSRVEIIPVLMRILGEDKEMEMAEILQSHIGLEVQIDR
ncbi:hypothetical protein PMAYCL1PPCAC_25856, partial [Pristionchus mayeri]